MDYNNIDEDDIENLRLAALMTLKKKSYLPLNKESRIQKSEKCFPRMFAHSNSHNTFTKNKSDWNPTSNKLFSKQSLRNVSFQKSAYPNNSNLISIIPSDIKCDFYTDLTNSTLAHTSEDKISLNIPNLNNKVSTKFSRLELESDSEENEDSESEINEGEESNDCDILSLGEKDKDLDDLDKLMDIMEAEIANGESSIKKSSNLKMNNNYVVKNATELNVDKNKPIPLNQLKTIEDSKLKLNPLNEELTSVIDFKANTNSSPQCTSLKSSILCNKKRSASLNIKYLKKCSTSVDHSKLQNKSLSSRKSSPIKENNILPLQNSSLKSQNPSLSLNKTCSSLSQVTLPNRRQLSPFGRKSKFPLKRKSRSPSIANKKSYNPIKKVIKSRLISPAIPSVNDNLQNTIKAKSIEKQVKMRQSDSVLKAVNDKKLCTQHTDFVDLRTEIERRKALRLNMNKLDIKKNTKSFYPTRLLQSAIKDVVDSSVNEVKKDKCSYKPEIRVQTEGNSRKRKVILLSENQCNYNDELESFTNAKRLKDNFKEVPLHLRVTGVPDYNIKQKGLKKIIRQNINVTDIDQVFDVLIICKVLFTFVNLIYFYHLIPILNDLYI
ncbi:uncharacterized protein LOC112597451 [Melanaphis sacchari]|uniref:uncharacterized protein LOC112597451 n=1 Tax=Melanaphis sacchari TaxID=742174 RepID=UPI000DC132E1|nr:uncharacterized protein LOC112597451 [Melanaphis sacchari]